MAWQRLWKHLAVHATPVGWQVAPLLSAARGCCHVLYCHLHARLLQLQAAPW